MCWMCDHPGSTPEEYIEVVRAKMMKNGWAVQYVESDRVPFAYTVGLTRDDLPEFLVTGVSPLRALRLLNGAARLAVDSDLPVPGMHIAIPGGPIAEIVEVDHPDVHLRCVGAIFDGPFRALQLVWADRRGRLPWSADFDDGRGIQPVLGVRFAPRSEECG